MVDTKKITSQPKSYQLSNSWDFAYPITPYVPTNKNSVTIFIHVWIFLMYGLLTDNMIISTRLSIDIRINYITVWL